MILVCPSCDAKFKIPDGAIPKGGRTVRCAKCKNSWHAAPTDIMRKPAPVRAPVRVPVRAPVGAPVRRAVPKPATVPAGPPATPVKPAPVAVSFDGKLDARASAEASALRRSVRGTLGADDASDTRAMLGGGIDDDEDIGSAIAPDVAASNDFGVSAALEKSLGDDFTDEFSSADSEDDDDEYDEDDFLAHRRADQRRQSAREGLGRERKLMTVMLGGLIAFWLLVFYVFIFEEENMRYYAPGTSDFVYGLFETGEDHGRFRPGESDKLTPSKAKAEEYIHAVLLGGRDGLSNQTRSGKQGWLLRGYIENKGTTGANVPQVRAEILDRAGKTLDSWIFNPVGLILRRGGKIHFEEFRSPIPFGAHSAKVSVVEGSKSSRDAREGRDQ
jgi:predicted Zn finger-like uncharacterized protein